MTPKAILLLLCSIAMGIAMVFQPVSALQTSGQFNAKTSCDAHGINFLHPSLHTGINNDSCQDNSWLRSSDLSCLTARHGHNQMCIAAMDNPGLLHANRGERTPNHTVDHQIPRSPDTSCIRVYRMRGASDQRRIGEADNPGPAVAKNVLNVRAFNPTQLMGNEAIFQSWPVGVWTAAETSHTSAAAGVTKARLRKQDINVLFGTPVEKLNNNGDL